MSGQHWAMILTGTTVAAFGLIQAELREEPGSPLWAFFVPAGFILALAGVLVAAVPGFFTG